MMMGELDTDEFVVAELLGMTVAEMNATMGADEFHKWRAFIVYRAAMQEKAAKAATSGRRSK